MFRVARTLLGVSALGLVSCPDGAWRELGPRGAERTILSVERAPDRDVLTRPSLPLTRMRAEPQGRAMSPPIEKSTQPSSESRAQRASRAPRGFQGGPAGAEPEMLLALARETLVYARPERASGRLGYLRAGARVQRSAEPSGASDCARGWYKIEPEGYVCVGQAATVDLDHPLAESSSSEPDREGPLPYRYALSKALPPALYSRVPTRAEQRRAEPEWGGKIRRVSSDEIVEPPPEALSGGRSLFVPMGYPVPSPDPIRAEPRSGFAFAALYDVGGRVFGLSTDYTLLALDRVKLVQPSRFRGLALGAGATLPALFVRGKQGHLYEGTLASGLAYARPLRDREGFLVKAQRVQSGGQELLETAEGAFLRAPGRVIIEPRTKFPAWVKADTRWIDVAIEAQTLVAYEGTSPVFATLVSTGRDGLGDPETTHSTVQGLFRIHTKHVTRTMDSDVEGDVYDLRDVPYVQYFTGGYALHAAYWHDAFGEPRSHGCINLSPSDARWLFHWTEPFVPQKWHGAYSGEGTRIWIHP